eukprot:CAMPEP_0174349054 /NCGR_PEP_ID=MMETSP0811_2-20130205/5705_1 /TAXON_ID=73025 ORGANISM="Eutreptiella gymnastica-like, Strain CCMP1594" /NCGR_SAMPLE_ID=MMETSP0811_2 /ASSEMBLY_ACC=CAM_ASM_000667 /LENGTH=148 /DNA_ID=CAMNT_0015476155 /DNA_START=73 /DNA_END=516 /DNA_ORIENTATION=-
MKIKFDPLTPPPSRPLAAGPSICHLSLREGGGRYGNHWSSPPPMGLRRCRTLMTQPPLVSSSAVCEGTQHKALSNRNPQRSSTAAPPMSVLSAEECNRLPVRQKTCVTDTHRSISLGLSDAVPTLRVLAPFGKFCQFCFDVQTCHHFD